MEEKGGRRNEWSRCVLVVVGTQIGSVDIKEQALPCEVGAANSHYAPIGLGCARVSFLFLFKWFVKKFSMCLCCAYKVMWTHHLANLRIFFLIICHIHILYGIN